MELSDINELTIFMQRKNRSQNQILFRDKRSLENYPKTLLQQLKTGKSCWYLDHLNWHYKVLVKSVQNLCFCYGTTIASSPNSYAENLSPTVTVFEVDLCKREAVGVEVLWQKSYLEKRTTWGNRRRPQPKPESGLTTQQSIGSEPQT